ncbi:MAG: sialate O-acetylesterase [Victivallaceae bacterium]|nr:sialate O-acetylesterase [Victivallaceae bacterium]
MNFVKLAIFAVGAVFFALNAAAAGFADYFSDNMVLQRDVACPVWGDAAPGSRVELAIKDISMPDGNAVAVQLPPYAAVADDGGRWMIRVNRMGAGGPYLLTLRQDGKIVAKLENVMFGDVYLCSGQSNMEFPLRMAKDADKLIAAAAIPELRLLQVENAWNGMPQSGFNGKWQVSAPGVVPSFSAVAFITGKKLVEELGIPIGLVQADWGGTPIESWISREAMTAEPGLYAWPVTCMTYYDKHSPEYREELIRLAGEFGKYSEDLKKCGDSGATPAKAPAVPDAVFRPNGMAQPAVHFNAMINPLIPAAFKGVLWYQGCANVGAGAKYGRMLKTLAADWRARFDNPEMPFVIVQIAPYNYEDSYGQRPEDGNFASLVYSQQTFADSDENAYAVVINDVGNVEDIHPTAKIPVGERIANICLKHIYGRDLAADSPFFDRVEPASDGALRVFFRNADGGLSTSDGKAPDWFELASGNGIYFPAEAVIDGSTVVLRSDKISRPAAARFAWSDKAEPNLRGTVSGLPVGCFDSGVPDAGNLPALVPEAAAFEPVYKYFPTSQPRQEVFTSVHYAVDNSDRFAGRKILRIGYFVEGLLPDGSSEYVFVSMDPFTDDIKKIGIPLGNIFQGKLSNLEVWSNVSGVAVGKFPEGAIEFWSNNFDPARTQNLPGASDKLYDWDDTCQPGVPNGHGSMQIHNISAAEPQVVFAFNRFWAGPKCEFGIGTNRGEGNPDYVYSKSGERFRQITIVALAEFDGE